MANIEKKAYRAQQLLGKSAVRLGLREDTPLKEGTPGIRVTRETQKFLGVKDMKIATAYEDLTFFPAQQTLLDGILSTSDETGAEKVSEIAEANVIFMPGSDREAFPGMLYFREEYGRGVSGVAFGQTRRDTDRDLTTEEIWQTMGHSKAKYTVHPEVSTDKPRGQHTAFWHGTMEGAFHRTDVREGYLELTERLNFAVASEFVTNNRIEKVLPPRDETVSSSALEVVKACAKLGEWGVMPPLDLKDYVPNGGEAMIQRLIGQSGLSTGNASVWDSEANGMQMTASGVRKDKLKPHQVLLVSGFTDAFDGVVVKAHESETPPRLSVEGFDNLLNYYVALGVQTKNIKTGDIHEIIDFAQDRERVQHALTHHRMEGRQLHFHAHPNAWNPDLITVVEPNANLVPYGNANAGCGTRAQAYYTAEMLARGMIEYPEKVIIAKMQKHGSQILSPFDYDTTMRIINPRKALPNVLFAPVDMQARS